MCLCWLSVCPFISHMTSFFIGIFCDFGMCLGLRYLLRMAHGQISMSSDRVMALVSIQYVLLTLFRIY